MVDRIFLDLETYSSVNLSKAGVYKYAEADDFEILLLSYNTDGEAVHLVELSASERLPQPVLQALVSPTVVKIAHNATFERICLSRYLRDSYGLDGYLSPEGWICTMVMAHYYGLPGSLDKAGEKLNLDVQKDRAGKALIKYFSEPCRATKKNGGRTRNLPEHDPDKWKAFKEYNVRDVETEIALFKALPSERVPESVWHQYWTSERVNDRGLQVDEPMLEMALERKDQNDSKAMAELREITGLANPSSPAQARAWLSENGLDLPNMQRETVQKAMEDEPDPKLTKVLQLYSELHNTATAKFQAMDRVKCREGRVHGMFQYYGAHTGRWTGKLVQMQNLKKNTDDVDLIREKLMDGLEISSEELSRLVRTAFVAKPGKKLIVADYSAIEARVLAWLAGEDWRLKAFQDGEDIYCASASRMFGVPVEKNGINGHLRSRGKVAELALGYQGAAGSLIAMGALKQGLDEDDLPEIVSSWRESNPRICDFWYRVEDCCKKALNSAQPVQITSNLRCYKTGKALYIELPSGRSLVYPYVRKGTNHFGRECLVYYGKDQKVGKWGNLTTYGGKLVENVTQAVARDLLAEAVINLERAGLAVVGHIHDEVIIEADPEVTVEQVISQMVALPPWAEGLPVDAEGYEGQFYKKE